MSSRPADPARPTPARRWSRPLLIAGAGAVLVATGIASMRRAADARLRTPAPAVVAAGSDSTPVQRAEARDAAERRQIEADIDFFSRRASEDPSGGADLANLAALFLQRGRESGDPEDALRAEQAARRSLRNREQRNGRASVVLASSLLSQHRFRDALTIADTLVASSPETGAYRALRGEVELELGAYAAADTTFRALEWRVREPSIGPRYVRWLELRGQPDSARAVLTRALADASAAGTMNAEQLAWYWLRLGDLAARQGHVVDAEDAYRSGLEVRPEDHRVLAALARLAAGSGQWARAVDYGERSVAVALDPGTLATLSDAHAAIGDSAKAREYAHALDVAVLRQPGAYHRAWSLFYLDHGLHVATVARKVREELHDRKDVYGYDLMAWALHRQGRDAEARPYATLALSAGTQDALLFYHAGMIALGAGDRDGARTLLATALRINPFFQPLQPALARAALAELWPRDTLPVHAPAVVVASRQSDAR